MGADLFFGGWLHLLLLSVPVFFVMLFLISGQHGDWLLPAIPAHSLRSKPGNTPHPEGLVHPFVGILTVTEQSQQVTS